MRVLVQNTDPSTLVAGPETIWLIDDSAVASRFQHALNHGVSRPRAVCVVNCTAGSLWNVLQNRQMPYLVIGNRAADRDAQRRLAEILTTLGDQTDPLQAAVLAEIRRTFDTTEAELLSDMLRTPPSANLTEIAREMFVSTRTLRRRCDAMRLRPPQRLRLALRVIKGVIWITQFGGTLAEAICVAGYSESSAFRRACLRCFGASPARLAREWNEQTLLLRHLRQAPQVESVAEP